MTWVGEVTLIVSCEPYVGLSNRADQGGVKTGICDGSHNSNSSLRALGGL